MRIAVLGLGIIGSVWARHWAADGHAVRTWNRTAKPDAPGFTADPVAACREAELIAFVLADAAATHAIAERVLPTIAAGAIVAQHATVGPDDMRALAAAVRAAGGTPIEMPFTGSKPAAQARQVVWFVGDDHDALPRIAPAYQPLARALMPVGRIGDAAALKLALNTLIANTYQGMAEAFELVRRAGLDADTFFRALDRNVARSGLVDLKAAKMRARDWRPQFSVKHMRKDLRLALALAERLGLPLPQTAAAEKRYGEAAASGLEDCDFSALLEVVRRGGPA